MNPSSSRNAIFSAVVPAPFGAMGMRTEGDLLRELVFLPSGMAEKAPADRLAEKTARQLERYYADPDFVFDLPLMELGTEFQRRVWKAICAIPRGEVLTYGQIAKHLRTAPLAVGQACGANWYPLIVPCHRVTATGGIGGFANHDDSTGFHLGVKRWLLAHEGVMDFNGLKAG
jgi:methylated-DNA-[protein]-cysteine S-methyltransferase